MATMSSSAAINPCHALSHCSMSDLSDDEELLEHTFGASPPSVDLALCASFCALHLSLLTYFNQCFVVTPISHSLTFVQSPFSSLFLSCSLHEDKFSKRRPLRAFASENDFFVSSKTSKLVLTKRLRARLASSRSLISFWSLVLSFL